MNVTLTITHFIIHTVVCVAAGALIGITYSWYRINVKRLTGAHRGGEHRPTYFNAYRRGYENGQFQLIKNQQDKSRRSELRGGNDEDDSELLTAEQWALLTES